MKVLYRKTIPITSEGETFSFSQNSRLKLVRFNMPALKQWNNSMIVNKRTDLVDEVALNYAESILGLPRKEYEKRPFEYRSNYEPSKMWEALDSFGDRSSTKRLDVGGKVVREHLKIILASEERGLLKPLYFDNKSPMSWIKEAGIKEKKSAGIIGENRSKQETHFKAIHRLEEVLLGNRNCKPYLALSRTQGSKTRLVWGASYDNTLLEAIYAKPLIDRITSVQSNYVLGLVGSHISDRIENSRRNNKFGFSIDYSRFDSSVRKIDIESAFSCIKSCFYPQEDRDGVNINILDSIQGHFIHNGIVMPTSRGPYLVTGRKKGVPSGSYFTNIVDTLVNGALQIQMFHDIGVKVNPDDILLMGDDSLTFTNEKVSLKTIARVAKSYGYTIKPEKCAKGKGSQPCEFVGRSWLMGPHVRDDGYDKIIKPEKGRKYSDDDIQKMKEVKLLFQAVMMVGYVRIPLKVQHLDYVNPEMLSVLPGSIKGQIEGGFIQFSNFSHYRFA